VSAPVRVLTRRQTEVLRLAANGGTSAEIAARLGVSGNSVNGILQAAYRALGVGDRAHAVAVAMRVGLLRPGDVRVPEALRARLAPVAASEAPEPRRDAAGRSGGDGAGFNGPGKPSSAGLKVAQASVRPSGTPEAPDPHRGP
jgi:DNA-binding CsgD family transcriptional regulator